MRSTRNQPFCWQEKKVFRLLRKHYSGSELVKLRCLYGAITEADSDFNSQDIKYYTKTIHSYSGLSKEWIPKGLKILQDEINIIKIVEERENGKFKGKRLIFTPENVAEMPRKTVPGKPVNGESLNGKNDTSEDSLFSEDSNYKEDSINGDEKQNPPPKNTHLKFVLLTTAEYDSLCKNYSKKVADEFIERLNNYLGSTGKRYKSHYYTILNWMRKDKIEKVKKPKRCPTCRSALMPGGLCKKCDRYIKKADQVD